MTSTVDGGPPQRLRQIRVSVGHFSEIVVLTTGTWRFRVTTPFGRTAVAFTLEERVH